MNDPARSDPLKVDTSYLLSELAGQLPGKGLSSRKDAMTIDERLQFLLQSTESLHASTQELHATVARHDAQIADLIKAAKQDGENIAALARIAQAHEQRLSDLEEGESQ